MPQPSKPQLAIYAACAVAILLIGMRFLRTPPGSASSGAGATTFPTTAGASAGAGGPTARSAETSAPASAAVGAGGGPLVVDVKGAVRHAGVYRLAAGARALDAVRRAGGLTRRADRVGVNLAARVLDGGEVVVPERAAGGARPVAAAGSTAGGGAPADGAAQAPLAIDLNTAGIEQLQQLDGVGPATAAKIVAYRTQHGGLTSVDQLDDVSGIGPAKLAAIRAQLGR